MEVSRRPFFLFVLIACVALGSPARAQYANHFQVVGQVTTPTTYTLSTLEALPQARLNVYFNTGKGPVSAAFTGVLLWDVLNASGIITNPAVKNDILRKTIYVTGSDGYVAAFTAGELAPQFGGHQVIVAYAQDGVPLDTSTGFARIIAPNDKAGGRGVSSIVRIQVAGPN